MSSPLTPTVVGRPLAVASDLNPAPFTLPPPTPCPPPLLQPLSSPAWTHLLVPCAPAAPTARPHLRTEGAGVTSCPCPLGTLLWLHLFGGGGDPGPASLPASPSLLLRCCWTVLGWVLPPGLWFMLLPLPPVTLSLPTFPCLILFLALIPCHVPRGFVGYLAYCPPCPSYVGFMGWGVAVGDPYSVPCWDLSFMCLCPGRSVSAAGLNVKG